MGVPESLRQAIEELAAAIPRPALIRAATELGLDYQSANAPVAARIDSPAARAAYAAGRVPAIFEVNQLVCAELARLRPEIDVRSVLDLGCGPATATLAAHRIFSGLQAATLVDGDAQWFEIGERLISAVSGMLAGAARFMACDLERPARLNEHDLVIISYALGEIAPEAAKALVGRAWTWARQAVVILEPGTPRGFDAIIAARDALIASGANIVAPCTHAGRCPLAGGDWCHFDTRLERTRLHQQVKSGTLPYEIEKFSYVIASRQRAATPCGAARIIRRPLKKSGHVILDLCTSAADARRVVVSRRDRQLYTQARAASWGDLWIAAGNEVR
jgi:ribosomal protein RSM22 (predicted rRNA methylase)